MSEHELDKLFSKKLKARPLDYNPKAWAAMEAMLEAKTRSYAFYWRSAAAILFMAALLGIPALNQPGLQEVQKATEQPVSKNNSSNNIQVQPDKPTDIAPKLSQEQPTEKVAQRANKQRTSLQKSESSKSIAASSANTKKRLDEPGSFDELRSKQNLSNSEYSALYEKQVAVKALAVLNMRSINQSMELELGEPFLYETKNNKKSINWGQAYVSAALLTSSVDFSVNQGAGFSLGVGYQKQLSSAFQIGAEINYVYRATPSLTTKHDSVFYSFSQERVTNTTQVKSLSQLQIPVYVNYTLANKHRLGVGFYGSVLLNADVVNSREQRSSSQLLHKTSAPVEQEENWVNPFGMGWLAQYGYILSPSLELGFRFNQSLTDVDNAKEGNQFLSDGRVFIQYGF